MATAVVAGETPTAAFNKATDPVIFVRGWVGPNSCGDDVRGYFNNPQHANPPQNNTIEKTIRSYGWNGPIHYVGYYECDSSLTSGPFGFDWINRYNEVGHNWELPGWQAGEENNGDISNCWKQTAFGRLATQDCSINNLAYHLAWYIYRNFSQNGQSVHLIGHSMGGLIIRSALFERPRQAVFPPTLLVESAVTVATPHDGNGTTAADNIGPMIERGLSSVWQSPPAASRLC